MKGVLIERVGIKNNNNNYDVYGTFRRTIRNRIFCYFDKA